MTCGRKGIARHGVLQPHDGADITGTDLLHLFALVRVEPQYPPHPLRFVARCVYNSIARLDLAGIDSDVAQVADKRIRHDLEDERAHALFGGSPETQFLAATRPALVGRYIVRGRQVVDDGVKEGLNAFVLESTAAQNREYPAFEGPLPDGASYHIDTDFSALEVPGHNVVVDLREAFKHCLPQGMDPVHVLTRDLLAGTVKAQTVLVVPHHLLFDDINDAYELVTVLERYLEGKRVCPEDVTHHGRALVEVCSGPVHLVDETDAGDTVAVRLSPDGFGLRFDTFDAGKKGDRSVEDAQRPADLYGKIDMPRGVYDIDAMVAPEAGGRGGGDGDAPFLLFFHPVHRCRAIVNFTYPVVDAGIKEDPLRRGRLARVDVRHDPHVSDPIVHCKPVTTCSGRMPCWPRPSCGCPLSS
ncbi:MAG: hypothetical protein A4E60_03146 [Syntrophorhabdus sp. PtaB.Bin047]|nr:MAG: hypothetical protein A4E60_03146 [Syntrophorhabdus sp. PtaB.Bin047]